MRRKILIITYHYLPQLMAASFRMHAWTKYLPGYGWEPIILTRHWSLSDLPWAETSGALSEEKDQEQGCLVYRTGYKQYYKRIWNLRSHLTSELSPSLPNKVGRKILSYFLRNFLLLPDEYVGWKHTAYQTGCRILDEHQVDVILATGMPWTTFLVADELSKERNTPWVADYRDPWTQPTTLGLKKEYALVFLRNRLREKHMMKSASALIHISEPLQKGLEKYLNRKVHLIPNGYDPELVAKFRSNQPSTSVFTLSFVGTLHSNTNPFVFLEGFRQFIERNKLDPEDCRLSFTGSGFWHIEHEYDRFEKIRKYIHLEGGVSQEEAIKRMHEAHILLLFPLDMEGCFPAKTFEYLASGRPILVSPDGKYRGVVKSILRTTKAGKVLNTPDEIADWVEKKYEEFRKTRGVRSNTDMEEVEKFSRKRQAETLAGILNEIV